MRRFVWWLRSTFCAHQWRDRGITTVNVRWAEDSPIHDRHHLAIKECSKCGWIWRQRL